METMEKYLSGLTGADREQAKKIEAELSALAQPGFGEHHMVSVVHPILAIQKRQPKATVEGILKMSLLRGLYEVLASNDSLSILATPKTKHKGGSTLK
jgi:hypothetical protein